MWRTIYRAAVNFSSPFAGLCALLLAGGLAFAQDWTHYARIAGHGLKADNAAAIVAESEASNVFGIEVDNDIPGRYESFLDPTAKLAAIRKAAAAAHRAGNKSFVYIAGLECITANAANSPHSFFKDHPDWVQRKLDGTPAVFGGGTAFWIKRGDEDVWVSPFPPEWRKRYMSLVRQIAATGIDGVYVDIPYWMTHFTGWEKSWASFDDYTVAAFRRETGLDARHDIRLGDVSDPHFRRWIDFRIRTITDFMKEIASNVKAANPRCVTIAEIYPGIEEPAPRVGADVYQLYTVVDAIAHEYQGMGDSMAASKSISDWFAQMIGMFAFRAFAGDKPSWMLNYSWDGEKGVSIPESMKTLFAAQLTAGANSWDAKGHVMSESNDIATRTQVFGWIKQHEHVFYDLRRPVDPVGVYFSPQTRDYFPKEFTAAFKGAMNLLLSSHSEFQIVTPRSLSSFHGHLLIVPAAKYFASDEIATLRTQSPHRFQLYMATGVPEIATQEVTVTASPSTVAQIAKVDGKLHVFLDNLGGIQAKRKPKPSIESGVIVSFPASAGSHVRILPFLGSVSEIPAQRTGDKLVAKIPPFERAIVVWCE
jgi:hypothetical protein